MAGGLFTWLRPDLEEGRVFTTHKGKGSVQTRSPNPDAVSQRTCCSHVPNRIVTTTSAYRSPLRSWHGIVDFEYGARIKGYVTSYLHHLVPSCTLMTGIVAPQWTPQRVLTTAPETTQAGIFKCIIGESTSINPVQEISTIITGNQDKNPPRSFWNCTSDNLFLTQPAVNIAVDKTELDIITLHMLATQLRLVRVFATRYNTYTDEVVRII